MVSTRNGGDTAPPILGEDFEPNGDVAEMFQEDTSLNGSGVPERRALVRDSSSASLAESASDGLPACSRGLESANGAFNLELDVFDQNVDGMGCAGGALAILELDDKQ